MHWPDRGDGLFETGAPDQRLRPILRFRVEIVFIQCEHLPAAQEDFAIDYNGVDAAAVRAINEVCNWIVNRYCGKVKVAVDVGILVGLVSHRR